MDLLLDRATVAFGSPDNRTRALDALSLSVAAGERVAVIGASGAGKSSLFRVLSRGVPLLSGKVYVGGRDVYSLPRKELLEVRRGIGTVRQAYDLVPQLSAGLNAALGETGKTARGLWSLGLFARGPGPDLMRRVEAALESVGLLEKASRKTADLSGGEQQRVAVARLLVQRPRVVLADEPVSAVDPATTERVLSALLGLNRDGATLVVNLHDVELARRFPRVVALKNGGLAYDGPPDGLTERTLRRVYSGERSERRETGEKAITAPPVPVTGGTDGIAAR